MIHKKDLLDLIADEDDKIIALNENIKILDTKISVLTGIIEDMVEMLPDEKVIRVAVAVPKKAKAEVVKVKTKKTTKSTKKTTKK